MMGSCGHDLDECFITILTIIQILCSYLHLQNDTPPQNIFCCGLNEHQ